MILYIQKNLYFYFLLLLHVVDLSGLEGINPIEDFKIINKELEKYSKKLMVIIS